MAKKKVSRPVSKRTVKGVKKTGVAAKKKSSVKKVVKLTATSTTKKHKSATVAHRKTMAGSTASAASVTAAKPVTTAKTAAPAAHEVSLGRPLITQEEKLFMLFHGDYLARQVFEFLRVETVKELEQYSPQQIVHLMSKPIRTTVDRIRQRLAEMKRSLRDDEHFAVEFREQKDAK